MTEFGPSLETSRARVEEGIDRIQDGEIWLPDGVNIHFHFSAHHSAEDLGDPESFKNLVRGADVVLLERAQWNEAALKGYNKVSKGDFRELTKQLNYYRQNGDDFNVQVSQAIYNSRRPIGFMDMSSRDELSTETHTLMKM